MEPAEGSVPENMLSCGRRHILSILFSNVKRSHSKQGVLSCNYDTNTWDARPSRLSVSFLIAWTWSGVPGQTTLYREMFSLKKKKTLLIITFRNKKLEEQDTDLNYGIWTNVAQQRRMDLCSIRFERVTLFQVWIHIYLIEGWWSIIYLLSFGNFYDTLFSVLFAILGIKSILSHR